MNRCTRIVGRLEADVLAGTGHDRTDRVADVEQGGSATRRLVRTATALVFLSVLVLGAPADAQKAFIGTNKLLQLQLSPDAGPVGTRVKVLVSQSGIVGYPSDPCVIVAVTFDGQQVAFVDFEVLGGDPVAEFEVPKVGPGAHEVEVQTSLGHALKTWFTVTTPSPEGGGEEPPG